MSDQDDIENLLEELRTFEPPEDVHARTPSSATPRSTTRPSATSRRSGRSRPPTTSRWFKTWDTVLEWNSPFAKWFIGGTLNISYNCLDRHVEAGFGDKVAYHWEGEPGDTKTVTYQWLLDETCRVANALTELGVGKGDRVAIYMPMVPELPAVMLACTRIGAPHTVVFAGFSADSLSGRINDAGAKVLVCADGGWRRGQIVPLKENSDEALKDTPTIEKVLVLRRTEQDVDDEGRTRRLVPRHRPEAVDGVRAGRARRRAPAVPAVHVRARPRSRRASCTRPAATSSASRRRTT